MSTGWWIALALFTLILIIDIVKTWSKVLQKNREMRAIAISKAEEVTRAALAKVEQQVLPQTQLQFDNRCSRCDTPFHLMRSFRASPDGRIIHCTECPDTHVWEGCKCVACDADAHSQNVPISCPGRVM